MADFEATTTALEETDEIKKPKEAEKKIKETKLGLNYTINLTLPKTDDPAVYDAIFKSLRENLLNE
ncbi:MAG: hypothetical protein PHT51_01755 [Patescibacteria group bacterium]|nr:hypothetical protein [Patescibacteria group bacterium]MDD4610378.1 hypothetical protein [Patescibacteria group bacterium]